MWARGTEISLIDSFIILVGISSWPELHLDFNLFVHSTISFGTVGPKKKLFLFGFCKYCMWLPVVAGMLSISESATFAKYLLKPSAISFASDFPYY